MLNKIALLSAFTVAATLSLATNHADAAPKKSAKTAAVKSVKANGDPSDAIIAENMRFNTSDCRFPRPEPKRRWEWKTAKLTAQFTQSDNGSVSEILSDEMNPDEKLPMASIAKLMTALVVFDAVDKGQLKLEQMISVAPESKCLNDNKFAIKGLPRGIKDISVGNALTHTLKKSSNTMAINLAIATSGSVEGFVDLMNKTAKKWGMEDTQFINPHGLPEGDRKGERTTVRDMLIMAKHIQPQFDRFKHYSRAKLEPWILKEDEPDVKQELSELDVVFKSGTIDSCSSLLSVSRHMAKIGLCEGKGRFYNAVVAFRDAAKDAATHVAKRFGDMIVPSAVASTLPERNLTPIPRTSYVPFVREFPSPLNLSSLPAHSLEP